MELDPRSSRQGQEPCLPHRLPSACLLAVPSAPVFLAPVSSRLIFWSVYPRFKARTHPSWAQSSRPLARCSACSGWPGLLSPPHLLPAGSSLPLPCPCSPRAQPLLELSGPLARRRGLEPPAGGPCPLGGGRRASGPSSRHLGGSSGLQTVSGSAGPHARGPRRPHMSRLDSRTPSCPLCKEAPYELRSP